MSGVILKKDAKLIQQFSIEVFCGLLFVCNNALQKHLNFLAFVARFRIYQEYKCTANATQSIRRTLIARQSRGRPTRRPPPRPDGGGGRPRVLGNPQVAAHHQRRPMSASRRTAWQTSCLLVRGPNSWRNMATDAQGKAQGKTLQARLSSHATLLSRASSYHRPPTHRTASSRTCEKSSSFSAYLPKTVVELRNGLHG